MKNFLEYASERELFLCMTWHPGICYCLRKYVQVVCDVMTVFSGLHE